MVDSNGNLPKLLVAAKLDLYCNLAALGSLELVVDNLGVPMGLIIQDGHFEEEHMINALVSWDTLPKYVVPREYQRSLAQIHE